MINIASEAIVAVGAIISDIPLVDCLQTNPLDIIHDGDMILVNGTEGYVEVIRD
jgi:predicted aconitase with swiveling domain